MNVNPIQFKDIVETIKEDVNMNIFELCHKLGCSENLLYRRMIPEGYKGLIQLKNDIRKGIL